MLDTNTLSYIVRNRSVAARAHLEAAQEIAPVYVSVVTEGEVWYGLAKRPAAHQVAYFMQAALAGLNVLPWTSQEAAVYGMLRADNERAGIAVGGLDMLIAAHALAVNAVLVTSDAAIARLVGGLVTVNWADDVVSK